MSEPTPTAVPADLQTRMSALIARMTTRGMTEPVQVYAPQPQYSGGVAVARPRVLIGTLTAYVATGGGAAQPALEGPRASLTHIVYFVPDGSGTLTESNYATRWLVLPNRVNGWHRVTDCQVVGPYAWAMIEYGGTADAGGNLP